MTKYKSLLFIILILPINAFAVFEFNMDFGYDKQIYGASRQNSTVSRNYSVGVSSYLFDLTAIDLNFSNTQDTTSQNDRYTVATGIDVVAQQNRMQTNVFGVGIKQMLAGRGARITPIISAGYARQFITSSGDITAENTTTLARTKYYLTENKQRYNSVFGSFILQIKLTERFSLKGSVKTLFPAFEFNKARDNIKYLVGFSWIF
jgi:hypothetical protein